MCLLSKCSVAFYSSDLTKYIHRKKNESLFTPTDDQSDIIKTSLQLLMIENGNKSCSLFRDESGVWRTKLKFKFFKVTSSQQQLQTGKISITVDKKNMFYSLPCIAVTQTLVRCWFLHNSKLSWSVWGPQASSIANPILLPSDTRWTQGTLISSLWRLMMYNWCFIFKTIFMFQGNHINYSIPKRCPFRSFPYVSLQCF